MRLSAQPVQTYSWLSAPESMPRRCRRICRQVVQVLAAAAGWLSPTVRAVQHLPSPYAYAASDYRLIRNSFTINHVVNGAGWTPTRLQ